MSFPGRIRLTCLVGTAVALLFAAEDALAVVPFTVQGPGVNPTDFRVTTFASGLNYPLGMCELPDGSVLVTVAQSSNFFASTPPGKLVRLVDADGNGIADNAGTTLYSNTPATPTSVRLAGDLLFVTGPPNPIQILRLGPGPTFTVTYLGQMTLTYPAGWAQHLHSELGVRRTPGFTDRYDLFFQVGARNNSTSTTQTVTLGNDNIPGATGTLIGESIHMITIQDNGSSVSVISKTQIASGLRNPAGFAFHPVTGDLYFEDNGIDAQADPNDQLSADELNVIPAANIGGSVEFFGFANNYTAYRTGTVVGGAGIQPLIAFQPIPQESEGPNQITFAPPDFPSAINTGIFLAFNGEFAFGGTTNDENPLVYANPTTGAYFHFIAGQQAGIGHLDGLLATRDSLFVVDVSPNGSFSGSAANTGVIYQIKSLVGPSPTPTATPNITISGTVFYCSNPVPGPVPNVSLALTGTVSSGTATNGSGNYSFTGLTSGGTYTVTPAKAPLSPGSPGINTVDVLAVQRHLLGIAIFPPGCRLVAADINSDGSISTADVIAVQRFALGLTGSANVGKYQFNPANRTYSAVVTNQTSQNYDALVVGDVASPFVE